MPTVYPSLKMGAPARLALFKREAAKPRWMRPMTWRDVRFATLKSPTGLSAGFNGEGRARVPVWYTHNAQSTLSRETWCDEVEGVRIDHKGWFTDGEDCNETARGFIVALPHGKFLAGYFMSMNSERVYFADIHDSAEDAARMADEHARVIGESESEYQNRWRAASDIETLIEAQITRLRECLALRNHKSRFEYMRAMVHELLDGIRSNRETLATDYKDIEL